eukprot:m.12905 g.12905  ORF g.12905 m.12905 type:complete len:313 (-) comp4753_c0_seq1:111-1049(-)
MAALRRAFHVPHAILRSQSRIPSAFSLRTYFQCSPEQKKQYDDEGFLVARNFLSKEETDLIREALETDKTLTENEIVLNDDAKGQTKLALWSNPGDGTLGMLTRSRRVVGTMETLLGGSIVHYHSKTLLKHPKAGGVWNWHQDYGYWYKDFFLTPDMATFFLAIDAQSKALDNGPLMLLKGSNKLGRVDHWTKGDQQGADLERVELARQRYEEHTVDLNPGDAVFFSALTLHASPGNHSPNRRMAFASCFTREDNIQYKDPYIPCFECPVVEDDMILGSRNADGSPKLTDDADKQMLHPDEGVERARKDDQN